LYFITFVDDHSAHVDVDFLKKKSQALASFRTWKTRIEKETGQKVSKIRTDNASELTSDKFELYLAGDGIVHQTTAPHSSQQNGVAERINRTLEESARTNLTEAGLSLSFWADTVAYGAATRNYCPTQLSLDGRIPEEVWKNECQDVSHLRPFGYEVWVWVLPVKGRPALAKTGVKCILLGYYTLPGTESKAYKCYDRVNCKVYKSRDVTFYERGRSSGWTEVITDLRNLPPIIPKAPSIAAEAPSTPEDVLVPIVDGGMELAREEVAEERVEAEAAVEVEEVEEDVVEAPLPPRTRRLPPRFDGMMDERAKLPKGRYEHKVAPQVEDAPELVEEEEFQAQARAAQAPEPPIRMPSTFRQAMASAESEGWANTMAVEFGSLVDTGTFEYSDLPEGRKVVTCKWVFSVKTNQWNELSASKLDWSHADSHRFTASIT
jgi:hypothetical protein